MPNTPEVEGAALPELSLKHQRFLELYLGECNMNACKAARKAGYKNHTEGPRLLQREDVSLHVKAALENEAQVMSAGEIARRLTIQAREQADMDDFVKVSTVERSFWVEAARHEPVRELAKRHGCHYEDLDTEDLMREFGADAVATTMDGDRMIKVNSISTEVDIDWAAAKEAGALSAIQTLKKHKDGSIEYKLKDPIKAQELLGKIHRMFVERQEISGNNGGPVQVQITRRIVSTQPSGDQE